MPADRKEQHDRNTSYPLLEVFWTMLIFFAFVIWLWMLFVVIGDIFRRRDIGGWAKAAWIVVLIVLPYFGVFIYLIAEHTGLTERSAKQQQAAEDAVRGLRQGRRLGSSRRPTRSRGPRRFSTKARSTRRSSTGSSRRRSRPERRARTRRPR